jgi:signal peptidase I
MKVIAKIFSSFVTILTAFITIAAAIIITLFLLGIRPAVVLSGSMEPTVMTGSVAFVDSHDKNVEVGDIIQYRLSDGQGDEVKVLHRVVDVNPDGTLVTKGDNNEAADISSVDLSQINGTYRGNIPGVGYILKTPLYLLMFVVIFLVLHLAAWILNILAEDDEPTPVNHHKITLD